MLDSSRRFRRLRTLRAVANVRTLGTAALVVPVAIALVLLPSELAARGVRASAAPSVSGGGGYGGGSSGGGSYGGGSYGGTRSGGGAAPAQRPAAPPSAQRPVAGSGFDQGYNGPGTGYPGQGATAYGNNVDRERWGDVDVRRDHVVDPDYGCCSPEHPVARVAAVVATAAAIGSLYYELPPSCVSVEVDGYVYERCGEVWYEPYVSEYETYYIVVNPPQ